MDIEDRFAKHNHDGVNSAKIDFSKLKFTKQTSVTAPTGGLTVDQKSRDAINAIITRLENLNLIDTN